jgi:hypothetical protein
MTWEWFFNTSAGAASLMGLVLGAILGVVTWRLTKATDQLIKSTAEGTQLLIRDVHATTAQTLERMDQRADERQREMMQAIQALKS